jgi:serine/threonine protein kinase/tetratricopeptide (TPR) repeat protein
MGEPSQQAKEIFLAAIEDHEPEQWPAFLEHACAGDDLLRAKVEKLLRARSEMGSFHEVPRSNLVATIDDPITERPGTLIGPYKLLEQIGEGGFGVVFMAEQQEPIRRMVALKVLKPGMDTRQVIARFEAERQALALMDHLNIAKMLDAGQTSSGRPYFVMDLVKGLPITEFCDQNRLTTNERLVLFVSVCRAVQHAHQKGIIHRDIKPSNVPVTLHDGASVPKIIDFGIAKALGRKLTDKTMYTGFAQLVGTPLYMSPEQAELSGLDIDTRTDIYSLGVLLYELLTGTTPFDKERFNEVGYDELRRIIREEEPPKPSARISTMGQASTTISSQRKSDPKRLSQLVRGELDWIVMKALEKDRNRRYETAGAFAADVQHYLDDEPVQACPPSAGYRFRKFARRKKMALAMAACVFLALAGIAGSVGWAARDRAASKEAGSRQAQEALTAARAFFGENRLELARQNLAEARALLGAHHVAPGSLAGEIETLEAELVRFEQFFALIDQAHQAEIPSLAEIAVADRSSAGTAAVRSSKPGHLREPGKAVPFLRKALAIYGALGQEDWSTALEQGTLGRQQVEQIRRTAYEELLWLAEDILGRREDHQSGQKLSPESAARRALAYLAKAETPHLPTYAFYRLRARCRRDLGEQGAAAADQELARKTPRMMALDHYLLGRQAFYAGDRAGAISAFEVALRLEPTHYWSMLWLGYCLSALAKGPEDFRAAALAFTGCIMHRPKNASAYFQRAYAYKQLKRYEEALADYSKAIELAPEYLQAWNDRGIVYSGFRQWEEAIADFSRAIELDPESARAWNNRGWAYANVGRWEKAIADYSKAINLDPKVALRWNNRGNAYANVGNWDKAIADYSKAIDLDPKHGEACNALAWLLATCPNAKFREPGRAEELAKKAVELAPKQGNYWLTLSAAHYRARDWKATVEALNKSMELRKGGDSFEWFFLAMAHYRLGDKEKARHWYDRAILRMTADPRLCGLRAEAASLLGVPDHLPPTSEWRGWRERANTLAANRRWREAAEQYERLVGLFPGDPEIQWHLGDLYANYAQWDRAAVAYAKVFELHPPPNPYLWFENAYLRLQIGDTAGYWKLCSRMLEQFGRSKNVDDIALLAHTWALARQAEGGATRVMQMAEERMGLTPPASYHHEWSIHVLGLAYCRAGKIEKAVECLEKGLKEYADWEGNVLNWLVLAMAHQRLQHTKEARHWLDKGRQYVEQKTRSIPEGSDRFAPAGWLWRDWLGVLMLQKEAEALLKKAGADLPPRKEKQELQAGAPGT